MAILEMLIGLPASGKSTWAAQQNTVVISSDEIRAELYGNASVQDNPQKVFQIVHQRIFESLANSQDTIYDATNLSRKRRRAFLEEVKAKFPDVQVEGIIFAIPFEVCLQRNRARDRIVPDEAMSRLYKSFNVPSYKEGFDSFEVIRYKDDESLFSDLTLKMANSLSVEQDNPHHSYTVGAHCLAAGMYVVEHRKKIVEELGDKACEELVTAASYHDIGKPYCKTFVKPNGVVDSKAHYYSHENVGAYDYLCYGQERKDELLNIALLINLHMLHYMDKKYQDKMKEFYGPDIWKSLKWLNKADRAAH